MTLERNRTLSQIFKNMATIYKYRGGDDRFKSIAYGKVAKVINALQEDISEYKKNNSLEDLPGVGEGIAQKIEEYLKTGKIEKYESLKKSSPNELLEMIDITGFGAQSLKQIHEDLNISTKKELVKALQEGTIRKLKGFGDKKVENMLRGLKLHKEIEDRMLLSDALEIGEQILKWIKEIPNVKKVELAGSLRRKKETIGDFDVLLTCDEKDRKSVIDSITISAFAKKVILKGNTKISIIHKNSDRQIDFRIVNEDEWGAALQYFTGSKEHNIHLRKIAKDKGYKISEYGIYSTDTEKKIAGKTEEEIYSTLGFQFIPPEMREDLGEIELASKHLIPKIIQFEDLKGDLQIHTLDSDGVNTLEEIVNHIKSHFSYEYIVITDHSKSLRIANGMDEDKILKQIEAIQLMNKKLGEEFVKSGIEVEILKNGDLDISDQVLSKLDWVTASIHTNFNQDNTERIIRACENPFVHCIGHPTGRLIGEREPYEINFEKVIEASKRTKTVLEINGQPNRLDLNDKLAMLAQKAGVKLVISSDSHSLANLNYIKLGVFVAQRAWCTKESILNSKSWAEIKKFTKFHSKVMSTIIL